MGFILLAAIVVPAVTGVPAKGTEILWDRYGNAEVHGSIESKPRSK
jgi:hypothetical protein